VIAQTFKLAKLFIVALSLAILAGCTISSVVARSDPASVSASKLVSARIVWVENPSIPLRIKREGGYAPITDSQKANGQKVMSQLLSTFRTSVSATAQSQLDTHKVSAGTDATIVLTPVTSMVNLGRARFFEVKATLRKAGSRADDWSVTIEVGGPMRDGDEMLLDKYFSTLMRELNRAGWVG
jgi:hypothetical protein